MTVPSHEQNSRSGDRAAAPVDRPVIFSAPMVHALLAGRKTQTRREAWRDAGFGLQDFASEQLEDMELRGWDVVGEGDEGLFRVYKPTPWQKVKPGDRLWVRENFLRFDREHIIGGKVYAYGADTEPGSESDDCRKAYGYKWKPSIHMPREASRLTLLVTAVKIERLQDISTEDCWAEGIVIPPHLQGSVLLSGGDGVSRVPRTSARCEFGKLWRSIHGDEGWQANPLVVAVSFEVVKANIDQAPALSSKDGGAR